MNCEEGKVFRRGKGTGDAAGKHGDTVVGFSIVSGGEAVRESCGDGTWNMLHWYTGKFLSDFSTLVGMETEETTEGSHAERYTGAR